MTLVSRWQWKDICTYLFKLFYIWRKCIASWAQRDNKLKFTNKVLELIYFCTCDFFPIYSSSLSDNKRHNNIKHARLPIHRLILIVCSNVQKIKKEEKRKCKGERGKYSEKRIMRKTTPKHLIIKWHDRVYSVSRRRCCLLLQLKCIRMHIHAYMYFLLFFLIKGHYRE